MRRDALPVSVSLKSVLFSLKALCQERICQGCLINALGSLRRLLTDVLAMYYYVRILLSTALSLCSCAFTVGPEVMSVLESEMSLSLSLSHHLNLATRCMNACQQWEEFLQALLIHGK